MRRLGAGAASGVVITIGLAILAAQEVVGWFTIARLAPGHYAVVSFLPGRNGVLTVAVGMANGFTVR